MAAKPDGRSSRNKPGNGQHAARKPPVEGAKVKEMDRRLPNRLISLEGKIKVVFRDKNHTTFWAVDEDHVARIHKTYGYLEKDLVARL
jgi:hypothetical protein